MLRKMWTVLATAVASVGLAALPAMAQVTLPTTGVDVEGHVTAGITALGAVVLVVVGGFFAFLVIRKGLGWARKMA